MRIMHLDDDAIERFVHGESTATAETFVRDHAIACPECRAHIAAAREEHAVMLALLERLDHPPPASDAATVMRQAPARRFHWIRRAAAIFLTIGAAGAAYAAPGSPVPAWLDRIVTRIAATPLDSAPPQFRDDAGGGIEIDPGNAIAIVFTSNGDGEVRIAVRDTVRLSVRAVRGHATFVSESDRLVIENRDPSEDFEIVVPRTARSVEIRVAGQVRFRKEDANIRTAARLDARAEQYILLLDRSDR